MTIVELLLVIAGLLQLHSLGCFTAASVTDGEKRRRQQSAQGGTNAQRLSFLLVLIAVIIYVVQAL